MRQHTFNGGGPEIPALLLAKRLPSSLFQFEAFKKTHQEKLTKFDNYLIHVVEML